jgi:hypothetical protein
MEKVLQIYSSKSKEFVPKPTSEIFFYAQNLKRIAIVQKYMRTG